MLPPESDDDIVKLKVLAASDPKAARLHFNTIVKSHPEALRRVIAAASRPGEGRLRQIIATSYRLEPVAELRPTLDEWRAQETDEFTMNAIVSALDAVAGHESTPSPTPIPDAINAYRYVAERLCHRVRNALPLPGASIDRLERLVQETEDPDTKQQLTGILAGLQTGFTRVAKTVEFDTGENYFTWDNIYVVPWLEKQAPEYLARYGQAELRINGDPAIRRLKVHATPFLLDTLFGNVWVNALQAVGDSSCLLDIRVAYNRGIQTLEFIILDSGAGFSQKHLDVAFRQSFTTKGNTRGRGLLECTDAVLRLQGQISLIDLGSEGIRIRLLLPVSSL